MNITPKSNLLPLATVVNPATDSLRRENNLKEVISQPVAASQSAADKGVASDKDKGKTPGQTSADIDFAGIIKKAEEENKEVNDSSQGRQNSAGSDDQAGQEKQQTESNEQQQAQDKKQKEQENAEAAVVESQVNSLRSRDAEVRAHELAHAATGGSAASSPSYEFETGPDGKRYAVGGEVSIDLSSVKGDPQATITKMQKVQAAALAPAEPSGQDRRVAATAGEKMQAARSELSEQNRTDSSESAEKSNFKIDQADDAQKKEALASDNDIDALLGKTLKDQEAIAPNRSRPLQIDQRATRIEGLYGRINRAFEEPPKHNFQLTA